MTASLPIEDRPALSPLATAQARAAIKGEMWRLLAALTDAAADARSEDTQRLIELYRDYRKYDGTTVTFNAEMVSR